MYYKKLLPRRCSEPENGETIRVSTIIRCIIVFALAACLVSGNSYAKQSENPKEYFVDCSLPNSSLQGAIDSAAGPTIINFVGTCYENVTITENDITLRGLDPASSIIIGVPETDREEQSPITNYGAQRTVIENLTIRGSAEPPASSGIAVAGAANVNVRQCVVENNHWSGIYAGPGSWVRIDDCIIRNNGGDGIRIAQGGFAEVTNSAIQDNGRAGIGIHQQGAAFIGVTIIGDSGPNTIESNNDGIVVNGPGRADIRNNTIEDNSHSGVFADLGGSVVLTNNTISGSGQNGLLLNEGSNGRLEAGNTILSAAANLGVGAAVAVYWNSNLHIRGGGNVLENTASRSITNDFGAAGGFALNVETVSSVLVDSGHTTIIGNVKSFNQTTVDLRNVDITGSVYADGLDGNLHFTDQTQPSENVMITDGNVYTYGDSVSIWGGAQLPTFDADIDCNGSSVYINSPIFINGHGFVNCPGIP